VLAVLLLFSILSYGVENSVPQSVEAGWKMTMPHRPWRDMEPIAVFKNQGGRADIEIDLTSLRQEIDGFGGAFNEKGWAALSLLTQEERQYVLNELLNPEKGAGFNICRVPIGASNYAVSRYTHYETKNDYAMKNFSIAWEHYYLLPYIKAAMRYRP